MISGILGVLFSIYFSISGIGVLLIIFGRYIGLFFNFVGYTLTILVGKYLTFLPSELSAILVSLLIILLVLKVVGRE